MKIIFRKISPLKKRRVMSVMKKAFTAIVAGYAFRYGRIDLNADLLANPDQHLETTYSYQEFADGNQSVNSIRIKTGSGTILTTRKEQNQTSEALKYALEVRCGDFRKSGPGARAKADARRNAKAGKYSSGSTIIPGTDALIPQNTYCRYHQNAPLSCKSRVKLADGPFQGDGIITNHLLKMVILMKGNTRAGLILFSINLIMIIQIILERIPILVVKNV